MNLGDDLAAMLGDWDTARIKGKDYRGVFNEEVHNLEGGVDRIPTFTMRTEDAEAALVARETDVKINNDVTWQVRDIQKSDDGKVTVLVLAS